MLLHYIDNEVPWGAGFGEWTSRTQGGGSTIERLAAAAFPERGSYGIRCATVAGQVAYLEKSNVATLAAGGHMWIGFWCRRNAPPVGGTCSGGVNVYSGANLALVFWIYTSGLAKLTCYNDGAAVTTDYLPLAGRWQYWVIHLRRSTAVGVADGIFEAHVDGVLEYSNAALLTFTKFSGAIHVRAGERSAANARNGFSMDYDEFKADDAAWPEPFSPAPSDPGAPGPSAARTAVLWRKASADSRTFADSCAALGVPRANLICLPNASANESLANYATFQTEVETGIAAYLALNPTVAANLTCFLVGYGVPGFFSQAGKKYSATSRLMRYGSAFSPSSANPLYAPAPVARLTKTVLSAAGVYLACRIDAPSLGDAQALLTRAATVSALSVLPDADTLFSDESAYRISLACQKLRILTAALGTYVHDAFVFGDTGSPAFGAAGSRAVFADDSEDSLSGLRSAGAACYTAIFTALYAAALGLSDDPGAPGFDADSFFEMLRIGGTFTEAVAVACEKVDGFSVAAGWPLETIAFQRGGYNVYRGNGGAEGIDWDAPAACLRPGQGTVALPDPLAGGAVRAYAARAVSSAGVEEHGVAAVALVRVDPDGRLLPPPPARPLDLCATLLEDGLLLEFSCQPPPGLSPAEEFDVLSDGGTGRLDEEHPVGTVQAGPGQTEFEILLARPAGLHVRLAVRARAGEAPGPVSEVLCVPLPGAPDAPRRAWEGQT